MSWLAEHCAARRMEAARRRGLVPERELRARIAGQAPPLPFAEALRRKDRPAVIAEIKFRSPSRGELRPVRDVAFVARSYAENGAAALSVLIDERHFGGRLEDLGHARAASGLPLLAKGFLVDPYDVLEARAAQADAVLLIAACLERQLLAEMHTLAGELGMAALVELHGDEDLDKIADLPVHLAGVNHRHLGTLAMDMDLTTRLAPRLPSGTTRVAESGLSSPADLARMHALGYHAVLIGTRFMNAIDPGAALAALLGESRP